MKIDGTIVHGWLLLCALSALILVERYATTPDQPAASSQLSYPQDALREHPAVADCAVVGVDDEEWGQRVCAAIEPKAGREVSAADLEPWLAERLAPYKRPRAYRVVEALPRNAMGKVVKPDLAAGFRDGPSQ